nr:MAG TPA: Baseplate structural protein [Caudoviricetes sp.]
MALMNKPDESIFASSAKQGEVDNFPDLLRGWGITFDQTQGIPPMEWFNFLFKRMDEKHAYLMQRGLPEWSATQDYAKGSCVQFDGLSYRALKAGKNNKPNESDSQYWVRWGFTLAEIARATLTQYGLTQLYTGYDSQREDLALTPKTAYQLKQLINSNTRSLGNFIPNSKKSSRVDSNSAEDVATSVAVKAAYDKGVAANNNAEGRVSKSGDTMTGNFSLKQGDYSGLNVYNNDGYYTRLEGNPHNNNSLLTLAYRTPQGTNIAVVTLPKKNGVIAYASDVVSINGDSMLGTLSFSGATESYRIGGYTWRMPIKFSGDVVIGNEKCAIGFNNNGSLHFGGLPGANQFTATLDSEKLWVAGDVKTSAGKSLNTALQPNDLVYQKIGNFEVRKYPDGTMLQTYFVDFNDVHGANSGLGGPGPKQLTWAVSFVGKPLVWGNITSSIEDSHDVGVNILTKSTGTTLYWYNYEHSNPNQGACRLQFLAIGRWK